MIDHDHNNRIKVLPNGHHPPPSADGESVEQSAWGTVVPVLLWLWALARKGAFLAVGFLAALVFVSEGLRTTYPVMGLRLSKIPGLGFLRGFEGWHRLDAAYLVSALLIPTVCSLYVALIRMWMVVDYPKQISGKWNPVVYENLVVGLGAVLLSVDAILFFLGASSQASGNWGDSGVSGFKALFLTVLYLGFVVYGSFLTVTLARK